MTKQSIVARFDVVKQYLQHPINRWFCLRSYNHACEAKRCTEPTPNFWIFFANSIWLFLFILIAITLGPLGNKLRIYIIINTWHSLQECSVINDKYLIFYVNGRYS